MATLLLILLIILIIFFCYYILHPPPPSKVSKAEKNEIMTCIYELHRAGGTSGSYKK